MDLYFTNGDLNNIKLTGMAITNFNVIQDTLLKGLNNVSGDNIFISIENNIINKNPFTKDHKPFFKLYETYFYKIKL